MPSKRKLVRERTASYRRGSTRIMRVHVQKWGNGLALRIPKPVAEDAGVREGTVVDMSVSRGRLIAAPAASRPTRLADLLRRVTKRNRHGEVRSGPAVGRETW